MYYSVNRNITQILHEKLRQAELPAGYEGEFGPGIKTLIISLYYGGNMTGGKLLEFLEDMGISISAGNLSNLLIKNQSFFEREKSEIYEAGLLSSPWQHFDMRGSQSRRSQLYHECSV